MPEGSRLLTEQNGAVMTVTFNNPPRHFFDERMSLELDALTRRLQRDPSVRAVVFTGTDNVYMTHYEVPELLRSSRQTTGGVPYLCGRGLAVAMALIGRSVTLDRALRKTPARELVISARLYASLRRMNQMETVFVTAINGIAYGMGCVFALACDIRLLADGVDIGLPESAIGMIAGAGGTQRLVHLLGSGRALEILLEGRIFSSADAERIGLVHRVVAAERLQAEAHATAARLSRRSSVVNRETKRLIYDAGTRPLPAAMRREAASLIASVSSWQAERSMAAYQQHLDDHPELTDQDIANAWAPLLERGVPEASGDGS